MTGTAKGRRAVEAVEVGEVQVIGRGEVAVLAEAEMRRFADALACLEPDEWRLPTVCAPWSVRDMAGHVLGMAGTFSGWVPLLRVLRALPRLARQPGTLLDAGTAMQVRTHAGLSTAEVVGGLRRVAPRHARWRARRRLFRALPVPNVMRDGSVETWRMAYLLDRIGTRDTWMHRADLAAATGRPMVLTAGHDGRIVADVVAEWAQRHGQPFTLELTGPAGGRFRAGRGGPDLSLDAVEFCRILSGRGTGDGLLATEVPF